MTNNNQIKIGLGIPTLNRLDLLEKNLFVYSRLWKHNPFIIVDNGKQNIPQNEAYEVIESETNLGVAASWNLLIKSLFDKGCTHALILNDDILFSVIPSSLEDFIKNNQADLYRSKIAYSVFIISKETFEKVGEFDEEFYPAYFEDSDYEYRIKLLGLNSLIHPFLIPQVVLENQTIQKDPTLIRNFDKLLQRYMKKWGGRPLNEAFITPFNLKENKVATETLEINSNNSSNSYLPVFTAKYQNLLNHRFSTFYQIFEYLESLNKSYFSIVETGMARQDQNYNGDGMSTLLFDEFVNFHDGHVDSVDIDPQVIEFCTPLVSNKTKLNVNDSVKHLLDLSKTDIEIDLIYFDSFDLDWNNPHPSSLHHIKELIAIMPKVKPGTLLVVDDNLEGIGKGQYINDFMKNINKEPLFDEYQIGWIW